MTKREVCPMCKGAGHIIVLNWSEHCPKCDRTGFVRPRPKPSDGVKGMDISASAEQKEQK